MKEKVEGHRCKYMALGFGRSCMGYLIYLLIYGQEGGYSMGRRGAPLNIVDYLYDGRYNSTTIVH